MTARRAVAIAVLAIAASIAAATAEAAAPQRAAAPAADAVHNITVTFTVDKFVRKGKQLVAAGAVVASYASATGAAAPATARQPFTARVILPQRILRRTSAAQRICQVLTLQLGPLHLDLLGLIVDLNQVTLRITADSEGGLLGSLLCGLANGRRTLSSTARQLTSIARRGGLSRSGLSLSTPLSPAVANQVGECKILDLVLGPLDLNVLGLRVQLSRVHLQITASRAGGILGSLLCGLTGPPPVPTPGA